MSYALRRRVQTAENLLCLAEGLGDVCEGAAGGGVDVGYYTTERIFDRT